MAEQKPHLIFLMADQLRFDVLGAYGDQQCPTPKLDLLADRSTTFERHYTTCPLCVPARASLMTGLYPRQHGAIINGWLPHERRYGTIRRDTPLLPDRLVNAGYRVAHIGVQHTRTEPDFWQLLPSVEFTGPPGHGEHRLELESRGLFLGDKSIFRTPVIDYDRGRPVVYPANSPRPAVFPLREDLFYDCVLADHMIQLIQSHDKSKPLALFGMFWLPHPPLWAPEDWANLIDPKDVKLPPTVGRWYSGMPAMQLFNIPGHLGAHVTQEQWAGAWAMYMGMVGLLDKCIGRVLAALDYAGMFEDAVIVFTADHGEMLGSHAMFQKMCLYEESARVPMFLKLPGQHNSHRVRNLTSHVDIPATLVHFAGAEPLPRCEGQSLHQLADRQKASVQTRPHVFASYDGNAGRGFYHRMARSTTHKLIHNIDDRPELYDLIEDPRETRNLAGEAEHKAIEDELRTALNRWMDHVNDDQAKC